MENALAPALPTPLLAEPTTLGARLAAVPLRPLLAGPVTLLHRGGYVGTGDIPYVGAGENLDVSFGSDDRFAVRFERRRVVEEKLLGKDTRHFVSEVDFFATFMEATGLTAPEGLDGRSMVPSMRA